MTLLPKHSVAAPLHVLAQSYLRLITHSYSGASQLSKLRHPLSFSLRPDWLGLLKEKASKLKYILSSITLTKEIMSYYIHQLMRHKQNLDLTTLNILNTYKHWLPSPSHFTQACPQAIVVKGGNRVTNATHIKQFIQIKLLTLRPSIGLSGRRHNKTKHINFSHLDRATG